MHLGHALENSLMDTMIRYQRLLGKKTLLIPGTDHAALPTQAKVEKLLMAEGMKNPRQELGREKLVEKIREFAEQSKSTILSQVKKMGTSADWSRLAYTFDDKRNVAVNELFTRMYNDGLIFIAKLCFWTSSSNHERAVLEIIELRFLFAIHHFVVRDCCLSFRIPVHHALAAIDDAIVLHSI